MSQSVDVPTCIYKHLNKYLAHGDLQMAENFISRSYSRSRLAELSQTYIQVDQSAQPESTSKREYRAHMMHIRPAAGQDAQKISILPNPQS